MYTIAPTVVLTVQAVQVLMLHAGQLMQLRAEVSKFMRFVVSDKDAEQLAALQVGAICSNTQVVQALIISTFSGAAASKQHNHASCGSQPGHASRLHVCKVSMLHCCMSCCMSDFYAALTGR